jgi:hypothetical protein
VGANKFNCDIYSLLVVSQKVISDVYVFCATVFNMINYSLCGLYSHCHIEEGLDWLKNEVGCETLIVRDLLVRLIVTNR